MVLTWWFARQLIDGNDVKSCSIDWRMEKPFAERILSNQGETADQTTWKSAEDLVSPSIYSGEEIEF